MQLNHKQVQALNLFEDNTTSEILYGGAAGGGKSFFITYCCAKMAIKYEGCRLLLGRSKLSTLKTTTLESFFEVCGLLGLTADMYNYNQQSNVITFFNGSQIILKDLFAYPSDPNFDSLGSLEITAAFIDEVAQITEKAKNIVRSRIRFKLDEFGLIPKILMSCNPFKGWGYSEFYKPAQLGTLTPDKAFIPAFVSDNPDISKHYEESLNKLDELSKQRLLMGNWEYDGDLTKLFDYDRILDIYDNDHVLPGIKRIVVDVARFGNDSTVIGVWDGFRCNEVVTLNGKNNAQVAAEADYLARKYQIRRDNIIVDSDGNGSGVMDILGCIGFVNNSRPLNEDGKTKYKNLKSQCYFYLAEQVNKCNIFVNCDLEQRTKLTQELEVIREYNPDKDGKRSVEPKDKIKEVIHRSPDMSDMLMMAQWHIIYKGTGMVDAEY